MRINDLTAATSMPISQPTNSRSVGDFEDLLRNLVNDVNKQQSQAEASIEALATGKDIDPGMVAAAVNKADLAFRTMIQVRNRLVQAFDELRQMQI